MEPERHENSSRTTLVVPSGITPPVTTGTAVPGARATADAALGRGTGAPGSEWADGEPPVTRSHGPGPRTA